MDSNLKFGNALGLRSPYSQSFYGKREDNNLVMELTKEGTLNFSKEKKILKTLDKMSSDGSNSNINFLFEVTKNLKYGNSKNSPLGEFLYLHSSIQGKNENQNIDWHKKLVGTLDYAISKNNSSEKYRYLKQLELLTNPKAKKNYASNPISAPDNPVFIQQAELIKLRNELLQSNSVKDSQDIVPENSKHSIKNNLDYFIGMSECSLGEKVDCLKILNYMMSDSYNIHPQLADKKVQLLAEILNDIVVKTPDSEKLQIKQVDQGQKGKCGAISMARKAIPYEHKLMFLNNIMHELDASTTMEVYDITDPTGQKKVSVNKAEIDYDYEVKNGSRILDAASENWMNIADNALEGGNITAKYISSDKEHYGMFADGHYLRDLEGEDFYKQQYLRASQKLGNVLDIIFASKTDSLTKYENQKQQAEENASLATLARKNTSKILKQLSPSISEKDLDGLTQKLLEPSKIEDKNLKIDVAEDDIVKKNKLKAIVKNEIRVEDSDALTSSVKSILVELKTMEDVRKKEKTLSLQSLHKDSLKYNARLFKVAAYDRVKTEFRLDIPSELEKTAKELQVPADKDTVLKKLEQKNVILSRQSLDSIKSKINVAAKPENKKHKLVLSTHEKQELQSYDLKLNKLRKDNKKEIDSISLELEPQLTELYSDYAKNRGHFWVGPEGSSGLCVREMIENISRLTGTNHYSEKNVKKALDAIQNGVGDSLSATNVSTSMVSGHAQYAYGVEERTTVDEKTGKPSVERFLAHDNTWGTNAESKHIWKDAAGNIRTDYQGQMGGKNGFLAFDEGTTGVSESELENGQGFDAKIDYHYPVYKHLILNGNFDSINDEAKNLIREMPTKGHSALTVSMYMAGLMSGNATNILAFQDELKGKVVESVLNKVELNDSSKENSVSNVTMLLARKYPIEMFKKSSSLNFATDLQKKIDMMIDKIQSSNEDDTYKKIHIVEQTEHIVEEQIKKGTNLGVIIDTKQVNASSDFFKSIKNSFYKNIGLNIKEKVHKNIDEQTLMSDFAKLDDNSEVKIILRKLSLRELTKNKKTVTSLGKAKSNDEIDKVFGLIVEDRKHLIQKLISDSTFETSVDDLQKTKDGNVLITWIDEQYNPESDESFEKVLKFLKQKDDEELKSIIDSSSDKALSILPRATFDIYKNIRNYKQDELTRLNSILYEDNADKLGFQKYSEEVAKLEEEHELWKKSDEGKNLSEIEQNRRLNKEIINLTSKYPEIMYQNLSVYFSYLEIADMVKSNKGFMREKGLYTGLPVRKIIPDNELEKITTENVDKLVSAATAISVLKKENNPDNQERILACKDDLNKLTDVFVRGNIRPASRNALKSDLNMLYQAVYFDDSKKAQLQYQKVLSRMKDDYILNYPQELLDVVAKEVPEIDSSDVKNKEINQQLVDIWSDHLIKAKTAADNTVFEIMLMQKVEEGKMAQIAQALKSESTGLLLNKKGQKCSLDSEEGIDFIFSALEDPANNNESLKYFFEQTGMVSSSLEKLMSGPKPEKYIKFVKVIADKCDQRIEQYKFIDDKFNSYIESLGASVIDTPRKLADGLYKYLEKEYKDNDIKNDFALEEYKEKMDLYIQQNQTTDSNSLTLIKDAHSVINNELDDYSEDAIERIIRHQGLLNKQKNGVLILKDLISESSDLSKKTQDYIKSIDDAVATLDKYRQKYQNPILEKLEKMQTENAKVEKKPKIKSTANSSYIQQLKMLTDAIDANDSNSQMLALSLLIKNDDENLINKLEETLFSNKEDSLIQTYAVGIFLAKEIYEPLVDYVNKSLDKNSKLEATKSDDQALLLSAEALVSSLSKMSSPDESPETVGAVKKLFIASCDKDAKTLLADKLFQRFINILPNKGECVNKILYDLINDKSIDINSKTTAIDVLGRSNTTAFMPLFENLVAHPEKFVQNEYEMLYILDVATKGIWSTMNAFSNLDCSKIQKILSSIDVDDFVAKTSAAPEEVVNNAPNVAKRIKERVSEICTK